MTRISHSRRVVLCAALAIVAGLAVSTGLAQPAGPVEEQPFGTLVLRVEPAEAIVLIDGREWNAGGRLTVELPEGPHDITVCHADREDFRETTFVAANERTLVDVRLTPRRQASRDSSR